MTDVAVERRLRGHRRARTLAPRNRHALHLADVWRYRHLLAYFGTFYFQKMYKRTWLGWLWLPLRPAVDIGGRALLFGGFLGVASGDRPYFMFLIVGSSAWLFFQETAFFSLRSLELHRRTLRNIQMPRLVPLIATLVLAGFNLGLYVVITLIAAVYFKVTKGSFYITVTPALGASILGLGLVALYGLTVGVWTSPLAAQARDIRFIWRYVAGFWYMLTPVIYAISSIPPKFRPLAEYNPLTAPVELFKYGLLETAPPTARSLAVSLITLAVLLPAGLYVFARAENAAVERL